VTLRPVQPMMAVSAAVLPSGPDWTYEVKWDGYRAQVVKNGAAVSLVSRNLKTITRQFPTVADAAAGLAPKAALIDGEIVALDPAGRPSFQALHHLSTSGFSLVYYAFDLLHLDGRDLMRAPLEERRAALRDAVAGSGVLLSEPLPGTPRQIEAAVRHLQLEGVVAKRRRSRYEPGRRSDAWVKVRLAKHQELVIGGYKPNSSTFDSLLVGYYEGESTRRPAPTAAEHRGAARRRGPTCRARTAAAVRWQGTQWLYGPSACGDLRSLAIDRDKHLPLYQSSDDEVRSLG
jgi:ATP-dependent DNA ligase